MVKRLLAALGLVLSLATSSSAAEIVIGQFSGLNNQDSPLSIAPGEAQDLLNVDITPGGKSVRKREGLALYKTLGISTAAIHGIYLFQDISGNTVHLYGNDRFLSASINGGSLVQVATGTINTTWQCTDAGGFAYCLTSNRDMPVRTSGTTGTSTYQPSIPLGTMVTSTPDRLVVAGVSGNLSTLYFSAANTFTSFDVGLLDSSPFQEVINSPGSRITHIRYGCGKVLWWKDQSFGYTVGSTQYDLEDVVISPNIGSLDNSSDEYNGHVYFRGQDNHIYDYDCSNLTRLSRAISPILSTSGRRVSNSWTQTSQSDFSGGVIVPRVNLSTTIVSGEITASSFSATDTALSDFQQGTGTNVTYESGDILISTNATVMSNNSFETGDFTNWTKTGGLSVNITISGTSGTCSIAAAQNGTYFANGTSNFGAGSMSINFSIWDASTNVGLSTTTVTWAESCSWTSRTITASSFARRKVKIVITADSANAGTFGTLTSDPLILNGSNITFYTAADRVCSVGGCLLMAFDNFSGNFASSISSANFISRVFDTTFASSTVSIQAAFTANEFSPYFELQHSATSGGTYKRILVSSGTNAVTERYVKYVSSFTVGTNDDALTTLNDVTLLARSTGTYYSAVNNAPNLTSWGSLIESDSGTITYYVRASTGSFTVLSSTPAWVLQTKNSIPNYSTGTYMQLRADFSVTAATEASSIQDFSFNWNEGTTVDKAYIKYFNDNVWVSVSSGTSGINNQIQRWDLLNQTWLIDNIGSNGFLVDANALYVASSASGKVYKFGGVTTDDGAAINSFWRSKSFVGNDPFVKNEYLGADFIVKGVPSTLTATYTVDSSTPTSYSVNMTDSVRSLVQRGTNFPAGKQGGFIDMKFQNNSSDPKFEVLGIRIRYNSLPWRPG